MVIQFALFFHSLTPQKARAPPQQLGLDAQALLIATFLIFNKRGSGIE
jgi:hypothetical protein